MAQIIINIPDAVSQRVVDGICGAYNYTQAIEGSANPPTKTQFAKQIVSQFIKQTVQNYEGNQAAKTAMDNTISDVEQSISLT